MAAALNTLGSFISVLALDGHGTENSPRAGATGRAMGPQASDQVAAGRSQAALPETSPRRQHLYRVVIAGDAKLRKDSLAAPEREELTELRRESRQLREDRTNLGQSCRWFSQPPRSLRVGEDSR